MIWNQFNYVNRNSAPNGNKQVEFAIEDLESPDIVINGYTDYQGLSTAMDFSDKENTLSRTFVSKYKVCLSYCEPGVIKQNGRGPNPKKMKTWALHSKFVCANCMIQQHFIKLLIID